MRRKNCYFEDFDLYFTAYLDTLIHEDRLHGYYIEISIPKYIVPKLIEKDIIPVHKGTNYWSLRVKLTNNTKIFFNGRTFDIFDRNILHAFPRRKIALAELGLKTYSKRLATSYDCNCYATRIVFKLNTR